MPQQWDDGEKPSPENDPKLPGNTPPHGEGDYDYEVVDPDATEQEFNDVVGELDEELPANRPIVRWLPLLILIVLIMAVAWPREGCAIREKVRTIEPPRSEYTPEYLQQDCILAA